MMRILAIAASCALLAGCDWLKNPAPQPEEEPPPVGDPVDPTDEPDTNPDPTEEEPGELPEEDVLTDSSGRVFSYYPAGDLIYGSYPPEIIVDDFVYDDQIVFPAEEPVFINSQVYGHGGSQASVNGFTGDQCNSGNYSYPWRDDFCEKRGKDQYFCADGGHTGVDIRPATCAKGKHWVVAPEAGEIYDIGSYGVRLMSDDGTWYQFLHLDMATLVVAEGVRVDRGQRIGKFSNVFYDSNGDPVPTTIHMHLDMKEAYSPTNGDEPFVDRVNPYMTLVAAYERKLRGE
jgi:murein DD-endopeptidase MepM/ murein hydrolase activator NlpD